MSMRKSTLIAAAVSLALAKHAAADSPSKPRNPASEEIETVLVTGIRASLRESLEVKRQSQAVVEVLTSEDVGKFPDKNVAEALQRVSGVSISREFGEGERVSIRGTAPNLNRTQLNGHSIATADWFVLDQLSATRSFNYLMLPTEVIGQTEVIKGSQADIEEGGIGGTVNVKTRNPLDLPSHTFSALPAGCVHRARGHHRSAGRRAVQLEERSRVCRRAGRRHLPGAQSAPRRHRIPGLLRPRDRLIRVVRLRRCRTCSVSALFTQDRVRTGANFGLQFRPTDHARHQPDGPVLQARSRQLQPQLHGVVLEHVQRGRTADRTPPSRTARWWAARLRTAPTAGAWCTTPSCATRRPRPSRSISTSSFDVSETPDAARQGRLHQGQRRDQRPAILGNPGAYRLQLGLQPWCSGSRFHRHRRPHRSELAAGARLGLTTTSS